MINQGDAARGLDHRPSIGVDDDDSRSQHPSDRVHDGQCRERLHEYLDRDLRRHAVHLPRGVQHRVDSETASRGRRSRAACSWSRRSATPRPATRSTNQDPYSVTYADGQSYSDPDTYDTCVGGSEGTGRSGRRPVQPEHGHLPERGDPGSRRTAGLSDRRRGQRGSVRVRGRLLLPEGE